MQVHGPVASIPAALRVIVLAASVVAHPSIGGAAVIDAADGGFTVKNVADPGKLLR